MRGGRGGAECSTGAGRSAATWHGRTPGVALHQRDRRVRLGDGGGPLTRRYHGLLVAALKPPLGAPCSSPRWTRASSTAVSHCPLFANRWADGTRRAHGYRTSSASASTAPPRCGPTRCADALLEKRVWMEPGANTTYVRYRVAAGRGPLALDAQGVRELSRLSRERRAATAGRWTWRRSTGGLRVVAFDGAAPLRCWPPGAEARGPRTPGIAGFGLPASASAGSTPTDDHLHAGTFRTTLRARRGADPRALDRGAPSLDGDGAWAPAQRTRGGLLARWTRARPEAPAGARAGSASSCSPPTSSSRAAARRRRPTA